MSNSKNKKIKPKNIGKTLGRILGYMGKYKFLWVVIIISSFISGGSVAIGSYFIKPALNNYIIPLIGQKNADLTGFGFLLLGVLCVYAVGAFFAWVLTRTCIYVSATLLNKIRNDLFSRIEKLPIKFYDKHTHGELMSRFTTDVDALSEMFHTTVPLLVSSSVIVLSVLVMMIILSPMLTIVMLATVLMLALILNVIGKKSAGAFRKNQENIGKLNGFVEEMIEGQKVIKVFNHEKIVCDQFDSLNDNLRKAGTTANTYGGILGPLITNVSHMQYALIAIVSSIFMILNYAGICNFNWFTGVLNIGGIAAFLQYTRFFTQPMAGIAAQANSVLIALAGAERIFDIIDEVPEANEGKIDLVTAYEVKGDDNKSKLVQSFGYTGDWAWKYPEMAEYGNKAGTLASLKGEVIFNHVTFGYKKEKTILHDVYIHAKPGMKIALVGSTGSGKTTTINLLSRFYDVPEGQGIITYDGIPIKEISKNGLRSSLGIVQQNVHLFSGTIKENIRYGNLEASDKQIIDAAKLANAHSFIKHLENGYDTEIAGDGSSLSQGQCQLLSIARTAVANPPVLILDEATSSIDTRTEKLIEKGMNALMKGRTTFIIAHRLSTVRNADEIIVLEHGHIIERGTHEQLIDSKGRYYFLYTGNKISLEE